MRGFLASARPSTLTTRRSIASSYNECDCVDRNGGRGHGSRRNEVRGHGRRDSKAIAHTSATELLDRDVGSRRWRSRRRRDSCSDRATTSMASRCFRRRCSRIATTRRTVTRWIAEHPSYKVTEFVVTQSSDARFHCITISVFYREQPARRQSRRRSSDPRPRPLGQATDRFAELKHLTAARVPIPQLHSGSRSEGLRRQHQRDSCPSGSRPAPGS